MSWIDVKYINQLSSYLNNFREIRSNVWEFSCPICGDSKKNKLAARGYIYSKDGVYLYYCHNCGYTNKFKYFLKAFNYSLYSSYIMEFLSENKVTKKSRPLENYKLRKYIFFKKYGLQSIDELSDSHFAKQYIISRKIPEEFYKRLLYTDKFKDFVDIVAPGKYENIPNDNRLVIPFLNKNKEFIALQGRALCKTPMRYITCKLAEEEKIYGMDRIDYKDNIIVVEGPIDSMFIKNSIALAGSDISSEFFNNYDKSKIIFAFDNEPRNYEIISKMKKWIDRGFKVSFWAKDGWSKDINDNVVKGIGKNKIRDSILDNAFSGLKAKLMLSKWRKK